MRAVYGDAQIVQASCARNLPQGFCQLFVKFSSKHDVPEHVEPTDVTNPKPDNAFTVVSSINGRNRLLNWKQPLNDAPQSLCIVALEQLALFDCAVLPHFVRFDSEFLISI